MKEAVNKELKQAWATKKLHGQYLHKVENETVSTKASFRWLNNGNVKGETEALITAAQDQALRTNYYAKRILKAETDGKCRLCRIKDETIDHVISGCSILAQRDYIERHDRICKYLHFEICKNYGIDTPEKWYDHQPNGVVNGENVTIIYNEQVHTDRTISANKPDIIIKNREQGTCILIDVAIPADNNVTRKEAEKVLKYRDLAIEIQRMWQLKVDIVPIVIGALGTTSTTFWKYLSKIPSKHITHEKIQTTALYGTAHILRKVLN